MAGDNRIFVDSNYFVALFNPTDALFEKAQAIAKILDTQEFPLVISNFVFLEVVTVLSQRRGRAVGLAVGNYLLSTPAVETMHIIDEELTNTTWGIFQRVKDKNISFVDCSIIAVMKADSITTLLTFDRTDFKKMGTIYNFRFYNDGNNFYPSRED